MAVLLKRSRQQDAEDDASYTGRVGAPALMEAGLQLVLIEA